MHYSLPEHVTGIPGAKSVSFGVVEEVGNPA